MKSRVTIFVLGPPGSRRFRTIMCGVTLLMYCLYAAVQHAQVMMGLIDPVASAWLTGYYLLGSLAFFLLVRTGWSERISADPSLMAWQTLHGLLAATWSYAITGPARGAVLTTLVLILAFGMFGLSVRQAWRLFLFGLIALSVTMAWKSQTDPLRYPLWQEAIHWVFAAIVLLVLSLLAVRMEAMRDHLRRQKEELEGTLERIRLLATQDELTGLANRRHMMALLKAEMARAQRSGQPLSVALLDLDHFKRVNDNYGHQAGDVVLMGFAKAASRGLRGSDVLARWGGEEFLLMLPNTGTDEAGQCVVRMRKDLSRVVFEEVAPSLTITFSAGLTTYQAGESLEAVTERADRAMYRAKEEGRNCTVRA
jgi:diguanylate cyclase (GGDEF)-like protein